MIGRMILGGMDRMKVGSTQNGETGMGWRFGGLMLELCSWKKNVWLTSFVLICGPYAACVHSLHT